MDRRRTGTLMGTLVTKLKKISLLWLEGFREACCFHRVITYCLRSRELAIRTGQCFLLNGFFFLGSIFILRSFIIPTLQWILPDGCPHNSPEESCSFGGILRFHSSVRLGLVQLFYVFWFYPLYIFSFILNTIWYNDIAKYGFFAIEKGYSGTKSSSQNNLPAEQNTTDRDGKATDFEGVMIGIAEQVYSILLLSFFFLEVYVTGFIPFIGKALNFLLLSWMYAYYCFEYKWNFSGLSLDKRLDFFESNWAFFAGFGENLTMGFTWGPVILSGFNSIFGPVFQIDSITTHCWNNRGPCVLAIFLYSPLVSYGVMAILYPLFVMTATGTEADKLITSQRRKWKGAGLGRIPIFVSADYLSMKVLSLFPVDARHQQVQSTKAL